MDGCDISAANHSVIINEWCEAGLECGTLHGIWAKADVAAEHARCALGSNYREVVANNCRHRYRHAAWYCRRLSRCYYCIESVASVAYPGTIRMYKRSTCILQSIDMGAVSFQCGLLWCAIEHQHYYLFEMWNLRIAVIFNRISAGVQCGTRAAATLINRLTEHLSSKRRIHTRIYGPKATL